MPKYLRKNAERQATNLHWEATLKAHWQTRLILYQKTVMRKKITQIVIFNQIFKKPIREYNKQHIRGFEFRQQKF